MPDLSDAIAEIKRTIREAVSVAVTASVADYDAATQTVTATPLVREERIIGGVRVSVDTLAIPGVPVQWPGGGGRSLTMGLADGDLVTLLVRHQSHDEVDEGTTDPVQPALARRMDLSDAVALPMFLAPGGPVAGQGREDGQATMALPSGEAMHVGSGDAAEGVARGEATDDRLDALASHLSSTGALGVWLQALAAAVPFATQFPAPPSLPTVESTRLKVDG